MASVSTSHLILFIASMLIAVSVAGTFIDGVQRLSGSLGDRSVDVSQDVRTDVEIISDAGSDAVYNDTGEGNVTVLVKNTGSQDLVGTSDRIDVLVNGRYQADLSITVVGDRDDRVWPVGGVIRVEIDQSLAANEDHRAKVIVNGDEEVFEFRT